MQTLKERAQLLLARTNCSGGSMPSDLAAFLEDIASAPEDDRVADGKVGFPMYFDREQWGAIIDGVGLEMERSQQRKAANSESNSNIRAEMCKEIILAINQRSEAVFAATPDKPPADVEQQKECERWLQPSDLEWLVIFGMQADDCDADGHTLSKERVRRLCELGVLRSVGFGRCEMTAFGHALFDEHWEQGISLPLRTHAEHNAAIERDQTNNHQAA